MRWQSAGVFRFLVSLGLALVLWSFVSSAPEPADERTGAVPLALINRTDALTETVRPIGLDQVVIDVPNNLMTVTLRIAPVITNVPVFVPAVELVNLAPTVRGTTAPQHLTIIVSGTGQQLSQLARMVVHATVDVGGRGPGTYTLPVALNLPAGVRIVGTPPTVTVTLIAHPPTPPQ